MPSSYFITGIGTNVGKTLASAIVAKALGADYWKPIQCGDLQHSDSMKVQALTGCNVHPETFKLQLPMSPHAAAEAEGIHIYLHDLQLPATSNPLIVEGAGGLLVPVNTKQTILDLILYLNIPLIVVSKHYLGSINHTLMCLDVLQHRKVNVAGILFNGTEDKESESVIASISGVKVLGRIPEIQHVTPESVASVADQLRASLLHSL